MLQTVVDVIILIGAVVVAVWNIIKFLDAGGSKVKKINEKHLEEVLEEKIPRILDEHSKKNAPERKQEIKDQIEKAIYDALEPVNNKINDINSSINRQNCMLGKLENGNSDILRREIAKIYSKYRPYEKITQYDKSDVVKLCQDYFAENGNSYVEDIYAKIREWEVVPSMIEVCSDGIQNKELTEVVEEIEKGFL